MRALLMLFFIICCYSSFGGWYGELLKNKVIYKGNVFLVNSREGLNLRNAPSEKGSILYALQHNTPLLSIKKNGLWVYVNHLGKFGWVHGEYLQSWEKVLPGKLFESGVSAGRGNASMLYFNQDYAFSCVVGMQSMVLKYGRYSFNNGELKVIYDEYIRFEIPYQDFVSLPVSQHKKKVVEQKKIQEINLFQPAIVYDGFSKNHMLAFFGSSKQQDPFIDRSLYKPTWEQSIQSVPIAIRRKLGL
jgi:hypothetical protein